MMHLLLIALILATATGLHAAGLQPANPYPTDQVVNIASGTETSLKELADALLQVMGSDLSPAYGPERKVNPVPRRLADVSKAKRLLGFETRVPLETGLRRLVAWWQAECPRT